LEADVAQLLHRRTGHFELESGHHGELWLDLELLCLRPAPVRGLAGELARRLADVSVDFVCGPLVEGAFVGLMVAEHLGVPFAYAERSLGDPTDELYRARYAIPAALRPRLRGARVAIANDVINAGSAVRGAFLDLVECGATPIAIATLAVLGEWSGRFAAEHGLALIALASYPNRIWTPRECPLCARGAPFGAGDGVEPAARREPGEEPP
jgi:orotate phosphoribosyltransferase